MPDSPYERQLLVCTFGPWCRLDGSAELHADLKTRAKEAGLVSGIRVTKSGCLGQCGNGPMMALWPDNIWYCGVKPADVEEVFNETVVGGRSVERLRYRPAKPGTNKTADVMAREKKGD